MIMMTHARANDDDYNDVDNNFDLGRVSWLPMLHNIHPLELNLNKRKFWFHWKLKKMITIMDRVLVSGKQENGDDYHDNIIMIIQIS